MPPPTSNNAPITDEGKARGPNEEEGGSRDGGAQHSPGVPAAAATPATPDEENISKDSHILQKMRNNNFTTLMPSTTYYSTLKLETLFKACWSKSAVAAGPSPTRPLPGGQGKTAVTGPSSYSKVSFTYPHYCLLSLIIQTNVKESD